MNLLAWIIKVWCVYVCVCVCVCNLCSHVQAITETNTLHDEQVMHGICIFPTYLKDRFNYKYSILRFGYPTHFAGTNNYGIAKTTDHTH